MKKDKGLKKKMIASWILVMVLLTITVCMQMNRKSEFTGITSERIENKGSSEDASSVFRNTTIKIHAIDLSENAELSGKICTADGDVKFHFTGDLYVSEKQKQGIEAYVAQMTDCENNFTVNYFEIKNDTSDDLFKYSEKNLNKRIISLDLERNGIRYYFELDMDAMGISFCAEHITEMASSKIDFYENYVNKEKSVAPCIISGTPKEYQMTRVGDAHTYSVTGGRWYHKLVVDSWFGNETIYEYYAEPRIEGEIVDVGTASSYIWTSKFIFEGHVEKNGVRMETLDNVFRVQAGIDPSDKTIGTGIEFQIDMGANTICTSGEFDGICNINGVESNYSTQAENTFVSDIKDNRVYYQFNDAVLLDKANHYLTFLGFVSTIDSGAVSNQETNCKVSWNYHMCYKDKILTDGHVTVEKIIDYIVNVKK